MIVASLPFRETTVSLAQATLKIKDGVCLISLGEKGLLRLQLDNSSTKSRLCKKVGWDEGRVVLIIHWHMATLPVVRIGIVDCGGLVKNDGGSTAAQSRIVSF